MEIKNKNTPIVIAPDSYTVKTLAATHGIKEATVRKYIAECSLRAYKKGKLWYILKSDWLDFVRMGETNMPAKPQYVNWEQH